VKQARDQVDHRGLAGAVRPDQPMHAAGQDLRRSPSTAADPAEALGHVLDGKKGAGSGMRGPARLWRGLLGGARLGGPTQAPGSGIDKAARQEIMMTSSPSPFATSSIWGTIACMVTGRA
jgi:hypothetical protein